MHAIAEIVIPPTDKIEEAIAKVMNYFTDENQGYAEWWDFYVIGGRFSGHKLEATLDPERMKAFHAALTERHVTVSSVVAGKETLSPASQIPMVDALWREFFPGKGEQCLLFDHATDRYGRQGLYGHDVCTVAEVPENLTCERLIIGPEKLDEQYFFLQRMLVTEIWNRVEFQKTRFDGKVKPALDSLADHPYKKAVIAPDWLVVTVDYHN